MTHPISNFYKNKNIFITGGTGFLGTVAVEKLLRSFPEIGGIYLLARPKKGISVENRKETYFNNVVFDRLKNEQNIETFSKKLHWIEGDITQKHLGISEENIRKLQNVINLIIHSAAELSFILPLKSYIKANIRATYDLLKIAEGCTKFSGFVYIGTAYCQLREGIYHTSESVLKSIIPPMELIRMAETLSVEEIDIRLRDIAKPWPAFYNYSKNCAENACAEFEGRLPVAIIRPAMVGHTYAEPKPYYIGNNFGFSRVLFEANRGFVLCCDPKVNANIVPVDMTINAVLAIGRQVSLDPFKKLKVYNFATSNHPCTVSDTFRYYANSIPDYETNLIRRRYKLIDMHDAKPGSPEFKMRQRFQRFDEFYKLISIGCSYSNCTYDSDNIVALWEQMSKDDKNLIPFDVRACDWEKYFSNMFANQYGTNFPQFDDLVDDCKNTKVSLKNSSKL